MALVRNWRKLNHGGAFFEIKQQCQSLNLKGCKRITIKFDPFRKDVKEIRNFGHLMNSYSALKSNLSVIVKTEILNDRSEQTVAVDLVNGEKVVMKCAHLTALDLFRLLNEYVTPHAPLETIKKEGKKTKLLKSAKF